MKTSTPEWLPFAIVASGIVAIAAGIKAGWKLSPGTTATTPPPTGGGVTTAGALNDWRAAGLILLALLSSACAGSFDEAKIAGAGAPRRSPESCASLDTQHRMFGFSAKASAAAAGGTGLATIPVKSDDAELALGATTAGLAAVAVGFEWATEDAAISYVRDCR